MTREEAEKHMQQIREMANALVEEERVIKFLCQASKLNVFFGGNQKKYEEE